MKSGSLFFFGCHLSLSLILLILQRSNDLGEPADEPGEELSQADGRYERMECPADRLELDRRGLSVTCLSGGSLLREYSRSRIAGSGL